eukprot:778083-Amphidinium_carterae.1
MFIRYQPNIKVGHKRCVNAKPLVIHVRHPIASDVEKVDCEQIPTGDQSPKSKLDLTALAELQRNLVRWVVPVFMSNPYGRDQQLELSGLEHLGDECSHFAFVHFPHL